MRGLFSSSSSLLPHADDISPNLDAAPAHVLSDRARTERQSAPRQALVGCVSGWDDAPLLKDAASSTCANRSVRMKLGMHG